MIFLNEKCWWPDKKCCIRNEKIGKGKRDREKDRGMNGSGIIPEWEGLTFTPLKPHIDSSKAKGWPNPVWENKG